MAIIPRQICKNYQGTPKLMLIFAQIAQIVQGVFGQFYFPARFLNMFHCHAQIAQLFGHRLSVEENFRFSSEDIVLFKCQL